MKELNKTNRLTIVVSAIILVFLVGLLTLRRPEIKYTLSPDQCLELLSDSSNYVSPARALILLASNDGKTVFIDVRNSIAFSKSHVKDARNIPARELFDKGNLSFLKETEKAGQTVLIYSDTPQQANGPWMMLRQTGFKNIMLLNGSFNQFSNSENDSISGELSLNAEMPLIDTAALKKLTATPIVVSTKKPGPAKKSVVPVKAAPSSGGGC